MGSKRDKQRYLKLTANGISCICEPHEAVDMMDDPEEYAVTEVWMTPAEYANLPEFMGW